MEKFLKGLLSEKQLSRLAGICTDVAQVALASIAIPFAFDKADLIGVVSGLVISISFWLLSVLLEDIRP